MIVTPPALDDVTGHAAQMYHDDLDADGRVFLHTQVMAISPEAHEAFEALVRAIVPSIGVRIYEAATLGAARALGSAHCLLAHGRRSVRLGMLDEEGLVAFAERDDSAFTAQEQAVIRYAERLSSQARAMTDADTSALRDVGFSDRQIVDITLAAAARNHFSRALLALAVPVEEIPGLGQRTADALASTA